MEGVGRGIDIVFGVDFGNFSTKISVDLLDARNGRQSGPACFKHGPVTLEPIRTTSAYLNQDIIAHGQVATKYPNDSLKAAVCLDDFMSRLNSHVQAVMKADPNARQPLWEYEPANVCSSTEAIILEFIERTFTSLEWDVFKQRWPKEDYNWSFVFSVPGCYDKAEKKCFENIIKLWNKTRNFKYIVIRQPVAAAIYAINHLYKAEDTRSRLDVPKFEALLEAPRTSGFILVDAGWRRTETISFHLVKTKPRIRVKRTPLRSIYNYVGSDVVDEMFTDHLRGKIKGHWRDDFIGSQDERRTIESFISWKTKAEHSHPAKIKLYGIGTRCIENTDGFLNIDEYCINSFFEPCVTETIKTIMQHREAARLKNIDIKSVVLVGGLGSNALFERKIRQHFNRENIDISVSASRDAGFAVARGSILEFQQWPYFDRNSSKVSYGIKHNDGSYEWFLTKGQIYRSRKFQNFKHTIYFSSLRETNNSLDFEIVRDTGDLESRPTSVTKSLGRLNIENKPFSVDLSGVHLDKVHAPHIKRFYKPSTYQKCFTLSCKVIDQELVFKITYDGDKVIDAGTLDELELTL